MPYIDAFVLAVPTKNLPAYWKMSRAAGKIWKEYGALEYRECAGDDLVEMGTPFPKLLNLKGAKTKGVKKGAGKGAGKSGGAETLVFSWILYKSRAHRDAVNKKVMADPRLASMCGANGNPMPFEMSRMSMAGCKVVVDL